MPNITCPQCQTNVNTDNPVATCPQCGYPLSVQPPFGAQPPYGTQGYGAPPPGSAQPPFGAPPPFGAQPPGSAQPPFGTQSYGSQPPAGMPPAYGSQPTYGAQPGYGSQFSQPQSQKKSRAAIAGIVAVIAAIAGVVGVRALFRSSSNFSESKATWSRQSPVGFNASVEAPGTLKAETTDLPPDAKNVIREVKAYQYDGGDLFIGASYFWYVDGVTLNPEGGARGAVESLKKLPDLTNVQYTTATQGSNKATVTGSFSRKSEVYDLSGFFVTQGQKAWIVIGFNRRGNQDAANAVRRTMNSFTLN